MRRPERTPLQRFVTAAPAACALALVLAFGAPQGAAAWLLMTLVLALTVVAALARRPGEGHRLRTLGNLVQALLEGDYTARGAVRSGHDGHARLVAGLNALAGRLQDEQRGMQESVQLLAKTLAALDGAVFVFEQDGRLRLVNPAGERLLGQPATRLLGIDAQALGLAPLFDVPAGEIHSCSFQGQRGRWQIGHAALRSRSQAGRLLVVQPMERALREEEAQAFRRLLRVLSHEINNSLAPIASLADTLRRILPADGQSLDPSRRADMVRGLEVIEQRSIALQRFVGGYARLARLPAPKPAELALAPLCTRVRGLMEAGRLRLEGDDGLRALADADQLEQVLINLLRNALEAGGDEEVVLRWHADGDRARIEVIDGGAGPPPGENLFVPFFTTKQGGSGIGLVLSRQIVEAQQGTLTLEPRADGQGAVATVLLPLPSK